MSFFVFGFRRQHLISYHNSFRLSTTFFIFFKSFFQSRFSNSLFLLCCSSFFPANKIVLYSFCKKCQHFLQTFFQKFYIYLKSLDFSMVSAFCFFRFFSCFQCYFQIISTTHFICRYIFFPRLFSLYIKICRSQITPTDFLIKYILIFLLILSARFCLLHHSAFSNRLLAKDLLFLL